MKKVVLIISLITGIVFAGQCKTINVQEYGAIVNDGKNDAHTLRAAVAEIVKHPGSVLYFPPGRYLLADDNAIKLQRDAMSGKLGNNPQDKIFNYDFKYVNGLDFTGAKNLTIEANGAELICDGWMEPISLVNCEDITINGLVIDYKRPPNSAGKIIKVGDRTVAVKFDDRYPVSDDLIFCRLMIYDLQKQSLCGTSIYHNGKKLIAPQTIRFNLDDSQLEEGRILIGLHGFHFRPTILIYNSKNTILNDVSIHAQPGMGIVGHLSENITMNRLRIVPRKGRFVSSNTDATHFATCRGFIHFFDCEFGGQGDDATNVHNYYLSPLLKLGDNRCKLLLDRKFGTHSCKKDYPKIGDTLAVIKRNTLKEVDYIKVTGLESTKRDLSYVIEYDGVLPDKLDEYYLANLSACPELKFVGCHVRSHRARSVLVKTRRVLIEDCNIENTTGTAIHIGAEGNWMEGVTSADVIVRNNKITNCGLGGAGDGTIDRASAIAVHVNAEDRSEPGLHKRILIEGNVIEGGYHAISVKGAEDVIIRNNKFFQVENIPIIVGSSRRVNIYSNKGADDFTTEDGRPRPPVLE